MTKTRMAWMLTAILALGCATPTEIRVGPSKDGPLPEAPWLSDAVDPEYEQRRSIPLSFIINTAEVSPEGREYINWSDAPKAYVLLDSTLVIFNADATSADVERFLHDFDAEVTRRIVPDGQDYQVRFNLSRVALDHDLLVSVAHEAGYVGEMVLSSMSAAKFLQVFCQARKAKDAYNIVGIGMGMDAVVVEE